MVEKLLGKLKYLEDFKFETNSTYMDFLLRVDNVEEAAKGSGIWATPHPWLNIFISKKDINAFNRIVLKSILKNGVNGPILTYPLLSSK